MSDGKSQIKFTTDKVSVSTIIKGPEIISSLPDKERHFTFNFASISTLDVKDHAIPDFPVLMEHKHCNIYITTQEVFRLIKSLESKKAIKSRSSGFSACS